MNLLPTDALLSFHDACVADRAWAKTGAPRYAAETDALWHYIELNHRYNNLLWDEEDLARRRDVADAEIAANKRAIDGYNQKRNDAIERIDEVLLSALQHAPRQPGSQLNSETAGSMVDRLSIIALKIFHMGLQAARTDAGPEHVARCTEKLARLTEQRIDLAGCLANLLVACQAGTRHYKVYRQFKMYNDATLNPWLYGAARKDSAGG